MKHVWLYTDLLKALKGECLSSVFSPDWTLMSASAAPHCGVKVKVIFAIHNAVNMKKLSFPQHRYL